jgi:general stress protein 26
MADQPTHDEAFQTLMDGIKQVRVAMMTTTEGGVLHTRPMYSHEVDSQDGFWFFTSLSSAKVEELERDPKVSLAYSDLSRNFFASVSGTAEIRRDKADIDRLWSEGLRTWFPNGKDDPDVALIRVDGERAEYWSGPSSTLIHLYGYMTARVAGSPPTELTSNEKLRL